LSHQKTISFVPSNIPRRFGLYPESGYSNLFFEGEAMGDYERSARVKASPDELFDFLADISNLPKYFDRMTSASAAGHDEVRVTANIHGKQVEGEAEFHVDRAARKLRWSSEGPDNYHGELAVTGDGKQSEVAVKVHTTRADAEAAQINQSIEKTLANIVKLVEQNSAQAA
jgi:hypothetical protein